MGRGRQKAKQTKVARELKYFSPATNYHALEEELRGGVRTDVATEPRLTTRDDFEYDNSSYSAWGDDDER